MTTATLLARAHDGVVPDDDPAPKPVRQRCTAAYKLAILEEHEQTDRPRREGALLLREGLYSKHIVERRRAARPTRSLSSPRRSGVRSAVPGRPRSSASAGATNAWRTSSRRHRHRGPHSTILDAAYATKFRHRKPEPSKLPTVSWINEPSIEDSDTQKPS